MTPEQLQEAQDAMGYSNVDMATAIGCKPRMLDYMKDGRRRISPVTEQMVIAALRNRIDEIKVQLSVLRVLHKKLS